jgi:hypothetical protein
MTEVVGGKARARSRPSKDCIFVYMHLYCTVKTTGTLPYCSIRTLGEGLVGLRCSAGRHLLDKAERAEVERDSAGVAVVRVEIPLDVPAMRRAPLRCDGCNASQRRLGDACPN